MSEIPTASIHGRFQVLHIEHYEYFRRAMNKYGKLYIGLTGLQEHLGQIPGNRADKASNPLTYFERVAMWRHVLHANGIDSEKTTIGPFPIERPELLPDFVPKEIICTTTIREEWNRRKVELLAACGYQVDVLFEDVSKPISSSVVRHLIRQGDPAWRGLVPAGVADYLEMSGLIERIEQISS